MYCDCKTKHKVKSEAFGKSFEVCSKNLGGCGKEIRGNTYELKDLKITINGVDVGTASAKIIGAWSNPNPAIHKIPKNQDQCLELIDRSYTKFQHNGLIKKVTCEECNGTGTVDV